MFCHTLLGLVELVFALLNKGASQLPLLITLIDLWINTNVARKGFCFTISSTSTLNGISKLRCWRWMVRISCCWGESYLCILNYIALYIKLKYQIFIIWNIPPFELFTNENKCENTQQPAIICLSVPVIYTGGKICWLTLINHQLIICVLFCIIPSKTAARKLLKHQCFKKKDLVKTTCSWERGHGQRQIYWFPVSRVVYCTRNSYSCVDDWYDCDQ